MPIAPRFALAQVAIELGAPMVDRGPPLFRRSPSDARGGMILRALSGQGVQVAFVIVAASVLLLLLVGWRLVAALVARRRSAD